MTEPDARVQGLVDAGQISPAEGDRLRRAMRSGSGLWTIVQNPVEYLRPRWSIALAAGVVLASIAVAQLGVRFDGAFDMHRTGGRPGWAAIGIDLVVSIPLTAAVFWLASLVIVRHARLRDFVTAVAVARVPNVLSGLVAAVLLPRPAEMLRYVQSGQVPPEVVAASLAMLPFLVWFFTWMYRGFAHSAGTGGARAGVAFAVAVVLAEAVSKGLLLLWVRGF